MSAERQLQLPEQPTRTRRESLGRAIERRRKYDQQQGRWNTNASLTFLSLAQSWRESEGSKIAQKSGSSVEDIASEMSYLKTEEEFRTILKKLKRANMPAKRVTGFMRRETEVISRKTNDQVGWTASFLNHEIDVLGQEFYLSESYVQKLKRQSHQKPLSVAS